MSQEKQIRFKIDTENEMDIEIYNHLLKYKNISAYIKGLIIQDIKREFEREIMLAEIKKIVQAAVVEIRKAVGLPVEEYKSESVNNSQPAQSTGKNSEPKQEDAVFNGYEPF